MKSDTGYRIPDTGGGRRLAVLLVLGFSVSGIRYTVSAQCPDGSPPPCRTQARPATATAAVTVAVLPFDNLSRDSGDAYLASGLTDEITTRLQNIERLTVTSATVMRRYRGSDDPRRVASEMRVTNLVAGSVRRDRRRLRVSVELINARSGVAIWRNAYNQPDTMLLDIEADIAASVARAINGRLLPEERAVTAAPRHNSQARDLFLRGNYDLGLRTLRSLQRAVQSYDAAARLDSTYAAPLAGLAHAYSLMATGYYDTTIGMSRDSLNALSRQSARRALRADSTSAEALVATANWSESREERQRLMERAVALAPRNADVLYAYANTLGTPGDESASREALRRAIALDPTRTIFLLSLGMSHLRARQFADAVRWLDSAVSFRPEAYYFYSDRGFARLHVGDTAGARADAAETRRLGNPLTAEVLLGLLAIRRGDSAAARATADSIAAATQLRDCEINFDCLALASLQASLGRAEAVATILERIRGSRRTTWFGGWPELAEFDPVRNHPRIRAILAGDSIP